ncbi:MAG: hypothetical protein KDE27_29170 [Planctomycetes bacterium]|nr:hypothetical protein [Planctomycetota bacterium]
MTAPRGRLYHLAIRLGAAPDLEALRDELAPLLPADELAGLAPRLRAGVGKVLERLEHLA